MKEKVLLLHEYNSQGFFRNLDITDHKTVVGQWITKGFVFDVDVVY